MLPSDAGDSQWQFEPSGDGNGPLIERIAAGPLYEDFGAGDRPMCERCAGAEDAGLIG